MRRGGGRADRLPRGVPGLQRLPPLLRELPAVQPRAHNHCLSATTEYVRDVEAGNFCEEFDPAKGKKKDGGPEGAKDRFKRLFGD